MTLPLNRDFEPRHGEPVAVARGIVRITAPNPSPFTFHGTNSYILGERALAVIDPGPDDPRHLDALLRSIAGRPVSHILLTHTHRDHSSLARPLSQKTGAPVLAEGPHRPARPLDTGEAGRLDASADTELAPDRRLADGETVAGEGWRLEAVATPGHTANHMAYALAGEGVLFCGDHVMGWSTTVVAPPDGSMADYMASLDRLLARSDRLYLPGHGGPIGDPAAFVRGLKAHRLMRERAILERLAQGDRTVPEMVRAIYRDLDPRLRGAAALSVLAHLEDLVARGLAATDGTAAIDGRYAPGTSVGS
jgi:glyoxylase-like metal-dependent hydrolase (beta-lactamase superfamily II)